MTAMYGWNEAQHLAEEKYLTDDGKIYEVGWAYEVTVKTDGRVLWRKKHQLTSDPRATLPNMDVSEGEIRIPLTDLVGLCLSRLPAEDIARALWSESKEVSAAFMGALTERYRDGALGHADRATFLTSVKKAVHSEDQQALLNEMVSLERHAAQRSFFWHETNRVNGLLRDLNVRWPQPEGPVLQLREESDDPDLRVGGKYWDEAREFWRAELLKRFPSP